MGWWGNFKARRKADKRLKACIRAKGGFKHKVLGPVYFGFVRAFGWAFFNYQSNEIARDDIDETLDDLA